MPPVPLMQQVERNKGTRASALGSILDPEATRKQAASLRAPLTKALKAFQQVRQIVEDIVGMDDFEDVTGPDPPW